MTADAVPGVFVYRPVDASGTSHGELTAAGCRVTLGDGRALDRQPAPPGPVHALLGSTHRGPPIGAAAFERWPELRLVAKYTIGTDDVDVGLATRLGILVTHAPTEANWGGVAEGTIASILALLKQIVPRDRAVKAAGWRSPELEGTYLGRRDDGYPGITVGIVGLGRIGRRVAELLGPWRVRLLGTDPYVGAAAFAQHDVEPVSLEALLATADVVTLHCNLTTETRSLIDARRLAALKPGAVLVNTSRGAVVDLEALCDALDSGRVAAAALDVFPEEPLPAGARILGFGDRVLLSPHMVAANRGGTLAAAIPWATAAVLAALAGEVPQHVYNVEAIDTWRGRFAGRSLLPGPLAEGG